MRQPPMRWQQSRRFQHDVGPSVQQRRPADCAVKRAGPVHAMRSRSFSLHLGKPPRNVPDGSKLSVTGFGSAACDWWEFLGKPIACMAGRRAMKPHAQLASKASEQLGQRKAQKGKWKAICLALGA